MKCLNALQGVADVNNDIDGRRPKRCCRRFDGQRLRYRMHSNVGADSGMGYIIQALRAILQAIECKYNRGTTHDRNR